MPYFLRNVNSENLTFQTSSDLRKTSWTIRQKYCILLLQQVIRTRCPGGGPVQRLYSPAPADDTIIYIYILEVQDMKLTKKLLALVLALMMAFSTLVMPAMAAENDEIMPRKPAYLCSYCNGAAEMRTRPGTYPEVYWTGCSKASGSHQHTVYTEEEELVCLQTGICGKIELLSITPIKEYCPLAEAYIYY